MKYLFAFLISGFIQFAHADLKWIKYSGTTPENAISDTQGNGQALPVCRGNFREGVHPGKLVDGWCKIGWGGDEYALSIFEVLVGNAETAWVNVPTGNGPRFHDVKIIRYNDGVWSANFKNVESGFQPEEHVWYGFAGGSEANGSPLLICNANYSPGNRIIRAIRSSKGRHPGKLVNGNCNFGYSGREIVWRGDFRILVVKGQHQ